MNKIEQSYIIQAPLDKVWRALTEPELIEEWSGAGAEFKPEVGSAYSLWDGDIGGEILEVVPLKKLVQSWKPDDWTIDNSVVTFTLSSVGRATRVNLLHENVEDFDFEGTTEGWDLYYLGAIRRMFEARPRKTKSSKETKITKVNTMPRKGGKAAKKRTVAARRKAAVKKTSKKRK